MSNLSLALESCYPTLEVAIYGRFWKECRGSAYCLCATAQKMIPGEIVNLQFTRDPGPIGKVPALQLCRYRTLSVFRCRRFDKGRDCAPVKCPEQECSYSRQR